MLKKNVESGYADAKLGLFIVAAQWGRQGSQLEHPPTHHKLKTV